MCAWIPSPCLLFKENSALPWPDRFESLLLVLFPIELLKGPDAADLLGGHAPLAAPEFRTMY